jgi:hypothetical protein
MSLTSFLNSEDSASYKALIPNLKSVFKEQGSQISYGNAELLCPPIEGYSAGEVGTAFDWWFRAWIQRINGVNKEGELRNNPVLMAGSKKIHFLKKSLLEAYWLKRKEYILGGSISDEAMIYISLMLARVEVAFREGERFKITEEMKKHYFHPTEATKKDLLQMIELTKKQEALFKNEKSKLFVMNPLFEGKMSQAVSGADGDIIVNNVFFDLKTSKYFGYKPQFIEQQLSYYLMAQENPALRGRIKSIGIYHVRFAKLFVASIEDIEAILTTKNISFQSLRAKFINCAYI